MTRSYIPAENDQSRVIVPKRQSIDTNNPHLQKRERPINAKDLTHWKTKISKQSQSLHKSSIVSHHEDDHPNDREPNKNACALSIYIGK